MSEKKSKKTSVKKDKEEKKEEVREEIIEEMNDKLEKEEKKEEKEKPDKKQLQSEKKMLFIFVGVILLLLASFITYMILANNVKSFTVKGITYDIQKEGTLTLYHARIPIIYNNSYYHFNVYFRTDPRNLESVPFNGSIIFMRNMAINYSDDINCDGDGTIAIANWLNVYKYLGVNVVRDPNATCDPFHRYVYVNISTANETSITETALGCYQINVANCDVLPATERFLADSMAYYENVTQLS